MTSSGWLSIAFACGFAVAAAAGPAGTPNPQGLLVALSEFEVGADGRVLPKPKAALLEILVPREGREWEVVRLVDPASNVFHKAMVYSPGGRPGILTLGGSGAVLKLWRLEAGRFVGEELWAKDFGGKFSRMREAEIGRLGERGEAIAVATHDQGVVAIVRPRPQGGWQIEELDRQENTFVHEIELGDLDGDGVNEIYATPSEPNLLDGRAQPGKVVRYSMTAAAGGREVVADLGERHAKEILVADVDGDGRQELYVSVEAVSGGKLEIRRYDAGTAPTAGVVVATLEDRLCRFLAAGDVDGDGRKEMVAAPSKAGLWLLRPPARGASGAWTQERIDADSSGFEHAALLADLDGDRVDELYVASDDQGEVRRYSWNGGKWRLELLQRRTVPKAFFTWNLMPVPLALVSGARQP